MENNCDKERRLFLCVGGCGRGRGRRVRGGGVSSRSISPAVTTVFGVIVHPGVRPTGSVPETSSIVVLSITGSFCNGTCCCGGGKGDDGGGGLFRRRLRRINPCNEGNDDRFELLLFPFPFRGAVNGRNGLCSLDSLLGLRGLSITSDGGGGSVKSDFVYRNLLLV